MAATLRYGRECALLGRSSLNFMRIPRDAHTADLTLGNVGDLLFTAIEVFIRHAFGRPRSLASCRDPHGHLQPKKSWMALPHQSKNFVNFQKQLLVVARAADVG
jgi:hypothetical protein